MAKKPFRGNYLTLENVRISYDIKTDTVHLTSKDKDIPKGKGFHLTLADGRDAEYTLRGMLENAGLIPEERFRSIPAIASYDDSPSHFKWDQFPLGVHADETEALWEPTVHSNLFVLGPTGTGKSVIERSIIFHCLLNPEKWLVYGVDMLQVELEPYAKKYDSVVKEIANDLPEALSLIRYLHGEMNSRYKAMEEESVNNYRDLGIAPKAIMTLLSGADLFLDYNYSSSRSVQHPDAENISEEIIHLLHDIFRLGRAAGIHTVITAQMMNETIFGKIIHNFSARLVAGRVTLQASEDLIGNNAASRLNSAIRGRGYFQVAGSGADFQSYFAPMDWFDQKMLS